MAKSVAKQPAAKAAKKTTFKTDGVPATDVDNTLTDLFVSELRDTYWAENHLVKSLPKMIASAGTSDLKKALSNHLAETKQQVMRLEKTFEILGEKIIAKKCDALEGLTMSGEQVIESTATGSLTRNMGIILSSLKVENFEITTYEGLIQMATTLGKTEVTVLLQQNLAEEIAASDLLKKLSQKSSNK